LKEADGILRRQEAEGSGPGAVDGAARAAVRRAADLPADGGVGGAATDWRELFHGRYRARTLAVWVLWFTAYLVGFGLTIWLPTVYSTLFGMELQRALLYGLATAIAGLAGAAACALLIDSLGRRVWFAAAFVLGGLPLVLLWGTGARSAEAVLVGASVSYFFVSSICLALYLYTPEIYPTRLRALGCSVATAWLRLASAIGPFVVGVALSRGGLPPIFLLFGVVAVAGGLVAWRFTTETKGRVLEEISP
jgi:putative MFS transporter